MGRALVAVAIAVATLGCAAAAPRGATLALRAACADGQRWDGAACVARTGGADVDAGADSLKDFKVEDAMAALDRAAAQPLDHASHVRLWEQRGIAHAYVERKLEARAAFDTVLALDPDHRLSCEMSPKATLILEQARAAAATRQVPAIELTWPRDLRVGAAVPIEVETLADPVGHLARATIYVRTRGDATWRAADLDLAAPGRFRRLLLPPVAGRKPISLELYAIASDPRGNEVLTWASPARPRELPLRYDPPTPWYRTWWVWAVAGGVVAAGTGVVVYATQWEPSDEIDGGITSR